MDILITTSFSILVLNTEIGSVRYVHQGDGLYYGIARSAKNIYVAARKRMVSSNIPIEDERGEILVFDHELKLEGRLCAPFPLRDLHQIAWHDGKLWATCSYDNMVAIWDTQKWQRWFPQGESTDSTRDVNHYNSFFFEDNVVWVLAHNHGPSELLAYSSKKHNLVKRIALGNQAHNIWREHRQLFICSSGNGTIIGEAGFKLEIGGFPRGYAFDGSNRYIGISELAERQERDFTNGKLLVLDKNWKLKKEVTLCQEGLVLDLLVLHDNQFDQNRERTSWLKKILPTFSGHNKN